MKKENIIFEKLKYWIEANPNYSIFHRIVEILSIGIFAVLCVVALVQLFQFPLYDNPLGSAIQIMSACLLAFFVADFVSGLLHFLCDNFGNPDTPIVGSMFIKHFLEHHRDPDTITHHDFIETNGNNFFVCALLLSFVFFHDPISSQTALFFPVFWLSLCVSLALTNQSHKWAHQAHNPRFVRWLQSKRILLHADQHQDHHAPPFKVNYCITSGVLNAPLEKIGFFERFERLLRKAFR